MLGCTSSGKQGDANEEAAFLSFQFPVDLLSCSKLLNISDLSDSVWYVPLETVDSSFLSKISEIMYVDETFYIVDNRRKSIKTFSKVGRYLGNIGKCGNGPGEFNHYLHFTVLGESVYILDFGKRICKYKKDGSFVGYITLPKQPYRIISLGDERLACYITDNQFSDKDEKYSWMVINEDGDSLTCLKTPIMRELTDKVEYSLNYYVSTNFSTEYPVVYKEAFNDSLYCIDLETLNTMAYGFIDLGVHKIDFMTSFYEMLNARHNLRLNRVYDMPSYFLFSYLCACSGNTRIHLATLDKMNGDFWNIVNVNGEQKITNDIGGPDFIPLACVFPKLMIGMAEPYDCADLDSFSIKEEDNPVLILLKLEH